METIIKRSRRHDIVFHRNGRIDILSRVARILGIREGDSINIACEQREIYLFVDRQAGSIGRSEAICHATHKRYRTTHNFRCYSKTLCDAMLSFAKADSAAGFWCGEGVTINTRIYVPIITKVNTKA